MARIVLFPTARKGPGLDIIEQMGIPIKNFRFKSLEGGPAHTAEKFLASQNAG